MVISLEKAVNSKHFGTPSKWEKCVAWHNRRVWTTFTKRVVKIGKCAEFLPEIHIQWPNEIYPTLFLIMIMDVLLLSCFFLFLLAATSITISAQIDDENSNSSHFCEIFVCDLFCHTLFHRTVEQLMTSSIFVYSLQREAQMQIRRKSLSHCILLSPVISAYHISRPIITTRPNSRYFSLLRQYFSFFFCNHWAKNANPRRKKQNWNVYLELGELHLQINKKI